MLKEIHPSLSSQDFNGIFEDAPYAYKKQLVVHLNSSLRKEHKYALLEKINAKEPDLVMEYFSTNLDQLQQLIFDAKYFLGDKLLRKSMKQWAQLLHQAPTLTISLIEVRALMQ